jgi:hypothetical protein
LKTVPSSFHVPVAAARVVLVAALPVVQKVVLKADAADAADVVLAALPVVSKRFSSASASQP